MPATISGTLLGQAKAACNICVAEGKSGLVFATKDNNYSTYAMNVYFLSVATAEAFMNEVVFLNHHWKHDAKSKALLEEITEIESPLQKYSELPVKLWGKELDKSRPPYQDFYHLVKIRNEITHYRMEPSKFAKDYLQYLGDRKVLLGTPGQFGFGHLDPVLNTKAAEWAYNTVCRVAKQLIELAEDETKPFIKENLNDLRPNFQEIP
ncbi:hypothetical protein ES708_03260 [subsurface metagenome]